MRFLFTLFIIFFAFSLGLSQIDEANRYSEEEVTEETQFVEASRLQLLGQYEEAIESYLKLIKKDEDNDVIYFQLSRCYEATKDYSNAIKFGKIAVELNPQNEFFAMQLGESYEANSEYDLCAKTYLNYTKQKPKEPFFYERAIYFFMRNNDLSAAIDVLDKMEDNIGVEESITRQKFEIYSKQGDTKKAIKTLKKLTDEYPNNERYLINLANYYAQIGDTKKAKSTFKEVLAINPNNQAVLDYLDSSNDDSNNPSQSTLNAISAEIPMKSISVDDKIAKIIPVLNDLIKNYSDELSKSLLEVTEKLQDMYPDEPKVYALKGDILMNSGNNKGAIEAYKTTLDINGSVFDVWYQLMVAQRAEMDYEGLLKTSGNALLRFPNQGIAYLFNGFALNKTGKSADAFDILQEAMIFVGDKANLRKNLKTEMARSKFLEGKYEAAKKILVSEDIQMADAYELQGDIAYKLNEVGAAVDFWKKAKDLDPTNEALLKKITQKQL